MQVHKYASIELCKNKSWKVYKYASMQVWMCAYAYSVLFDETVLQNSVLFGGTVPPNSFTPFFAQTGYFWESG